MTNIEQIDQHLRNGNFIAVSNGNKKLSKPNVTIGKFNFSLEDVLKESPSVEAFLKSLPNKGFGNGSIMHFREHRAGAIRTMSVNGKEGIELTFADQPNSALASPAAHTTPQPSQPMQNQYTPPAPAPTQPTGAMGFTQMPIHELVSLQVQKERHHDLQRDLEQARKDRDQAQSELRTAKEKEASLQIRLDGIEDRHKFDIERAEANQRKWFDKIEPNKLLEQMPHLAGVITALKGSVAQSQIGMGSPIPQMSEPKMNFVEVLKQVPDDLLPLMDAFAYQIMTNEAYRNEATMYLENLAQQNQG